MRRISMYFLALLMGCGTIEPNSNNTSNPCFGNSCNDAFQSDSHITKSDTDSSTNDSKSVDSSSDSADTTTSTCSDPNTMPSNCKPAEAVNAKCLSGTCDSWFRKGQTCQTDAECQKIPSFDEAKKKAETGSCDNSNGVCKDGWYPGRKCKYENTVCQANPVAPCVCWGHCNFLGIWLEKSNGGNFIHDITTFREDDKMCQVGEILQIAPEVGIYWSYKESFPDKMVIVNSPSSEIYFGNYCSVQSKDNTAFSCSQDNNTNCKEDNQCGGNLKQGSCGDNSPCSSDYDCLSVGETTCKNTKCNITGEACHKHLATDSDSCSFIMQPCLPSDKNHLTNMVCYGSFSNCTKTVWTRF